MPTAGLSPLPHPISQHIAHRPRWRRLLGAWGAAAALIGLGLTSCSDPNTGRKQPYPTPAVAEFIAHLEASGQRAKSYVAQSTMDYWVGDERVKATVYVMGERGRKVRFNALNPATDTTAADLGCDGSNFAFIDYEHNCTLAGVCDRQAIAQLLRVNLAPDDFLLLVAGSAPLVADPTGTVAWDAERGAWKLDLVSPGRSARQTLYLDGDDEGGKWEVLSATVWDAEDRIDWTLDNKDFRTVQGEDGTAFRVPSRSKLVQPQHKADLVVDWGDRTFNLEIEDQKFSVAVPEGLAMCGRKSDGQVTGGPAPSAEPTAP